MENRALTTSRTLYGTVSRIDKVLVYFTDTNKKIHTLVKQELFALTKYQDQRYANIVHMCPGAELAIQQKVTDGKIEIESSTILFRQQPKHLTA